MPTIMMALMSQPSFPGAELLLVVTVTMLILEAPIASAITLSCPDYAVRYEDYCYATMDKCSPWAAGYNDCSINCQDSALPLPLGWELAPPSEDVVQQLLLQHSFGTHVAVFSDGSDYWTSYNGLKAGQLFGWTASSGQQTALGASSNGYFVNGCSRKVMMRSGAWSLSEGKYCSGSRTRVADMPESRWPGCLHGRWILHCNQPLSKQQPVLSNIRKLRGDKLVFRRSCLLQAHRRWIDHSYF